MIHIIHIICYKFRFTRQQRSQCAEPEQGADKHVRLMQLTILAAVKKGSEYKFMSVSIPGEKKTKSRRSVWNDKKCIYVAVKLSVTGNFSFMHTKFKNKFI